MAVMTLSKDLGGGSRMVLGHVCRYPSGEYWFNPKIPHRRSSRVFKDKPEDVIPRWARNQADFYEREGDPWIRNRHGAIVGVAGK